MTETPADASLLPLTQALLLAQQQAGRSLGGYHRCHRRVLAGAIPTTRTASGRFFVDRKDLGQLIAAMAATPAAGAQAAITK